MNPLTQSKNTTILPVLVVLTLACFALSPTAQALLPPPPPDGGYPGQNTAEGTNALLNLSVPGGLDNTAIGFDALESNTAGRYNTATGSHALLSITDGVENTAVGAYALQSITGFNPSDNTAVGAFALENNQSGLFNTAVGADALLSSTTSNNTATGYRALWLNTTGSNNTALGFRALGADIAGTITGSNNTATGAQALLSNTTGSNNTADGFKALLLNTTGAQNTATGTGALANNHAANNNTADGFQALFHNASGAHNTAVGEHALFNNTGSSNIALGANAGGNLTMGNNNIDIGNVGVAAESNTIRIGSVQTRTFIKGISGVAIAGASVVVNAGGQLGVAPSSADFKHEIRPMGEESEAILAFKPVSFCYNQDIDEQGLPQFGLVAEDVEKVNPDLVLRNEQGKPYTVRYDAVNAMLLNEFLKEHREVVELKSIVAEQRRDMQEMATQLKEQAAQIQRVSAQRELSKPAPQTVLNNQ